MVWLYLYAVILGPFQRLFNGFKPVCLGSKLQEGGTMQWMLKPRRSVSSSILDSAFFSSILDSALHGRARLCFGLVVLSGSVPSNFLVCRHQPSLWVSFRFISGATLLQRDCFGRQSLLFESHIQELVKHSNVSNIFAGLKAISLRPVSKLYESLVQCRFKRLAQTKI